MNTTMLGFMIGMPEALLILGIVLLLFGAKKLPEMAKGLGQGIKEFKSASREITHAKDDPKPEDDTNKSPKE